MTPKRLQELFENMAQYIYEDMSTACMTEEDIRRVFINKIGFTEDEYYSEIGGIPLF